LSGAPGSRSTRHCSAFRTGRPLVSSRPTCARTQAWSQ